jgi:hypothetical protein
MSKEIRRREFLILVAATLADRKTVAKTAPAERVVDAGPASDYSSDGIYTTFRDQGFFLIRKGKELLALSRSARIGNVSCRPGQTDLSTASVTDRPLIRMGK